MRAFVVVLAALSTLACGGLPLPGAEAEKPVEGASADEAPKGKVKLNLEGRWCEENPEVGCYRFAGSAVHEEAVRLRKGTKHASDGTWTVEDDMLLMRFPSGTWTLQVLKHTESILIVKDWSQDETFTFVRRDE